MIIILSEISRTLNLLQIVVSRVFYLEHLFLHLVLQRKERKFRYIIELAVNYVIHFKPK